MDILKPFKDMGKVQAMKYRARAFKARNTRLENEVQRLQALIKDDILTLRAATKKYKGNEYQTYEKAVNEINDKYIGIADWGVLQTGSIVDLRAAFSIGEGIKIIEKAKAPAEVKWIESFLRYNDLDREVVQEFAKEAEIEGKIAIKLFIEERDKQVNVTARYISWTDKKYTVETDPQDYLRYSKLRWRPKDKDTDEVLEEAEFVYKKFGGRINRPNEAAPKIMKCLTQIENLDKALRDWREINDLYAPPIPTLECEDAKAAKEMNDAVENINFKIKK